MKQEIMFLHSAKAGGVAVDFISVELVKKADTTSIYNALNPAKERVGFEKHDWMKKSQQKLQHCTEFVLCCRFCFLTALRHINLSTFHKCIPDVFPFLCSLGTYKMQISNIFRFLATGDSYKTIAFTYRLGHATVARIVAETCEAIWKTMKREYVPQPSEVDRVKNTDGFERQWNFPNCIGALDGKYFVIQAPSGSETYKS